MKQYTITQFKDWQSVPIVNINNVFKLQAEGVSASAQIAYEKDNILVHLFAKEKDIRKEENDVLGMPCYDSCLEFFFCPNPEEDRYFNIEFNSNACVFFGFSGGADSIMRQIPENDILDFFKPKIAKNEDNWEIYYEIPFTLIRRYFPNFNVYDGKAIRANCFKCSDNSTPPHYLSWNLVEGEPFTFHKPEYFGTMKFVR